MSNIALTALVFWEFFKIGLFSVGGGPATLPYLMDLTTRFDWFTMEELTNMIAVSESTPGPLGINMATYAGFQTLGIFGGIVATLGLVLPSIIIICLIAAFFTRFNSNRFVQSAFSAIRPAVCAIICVSVLSICRVSLFSSFNIVEKTIEPIWRSIILALATLGLFQIKPLKKIHPFFWFVFGAIIGIAFKF
ncbi:MAG: chromate transporter [Treponema sp.]|nr:chromate transporter [Treponema sp.]